MSSDRLDASDDAILVTKAISDLGDMLDAVTTDEDGNALSTWMDEHRREATAATILAALTTDRMVPAAGQPLDKLDHDNVRYAVVLADALRAELVRPRSTSRRSRPARRRR